MKPTTESILGARIPLDDINMTYKDAYFLKVKKGSTVVVEHSFGWGGFADALAISTNLTQDEIVMPWDNFSFGDDILNETKKFNGYIVRIGQESGWSDSNIHLSKIKFTFNTRDAEKIDIIPYVEKAILKYVEPHITVPTIKRGEFKQRNILDLVGVQPINIPKNEDASNDESLFKIKFVETEPEKILEIGEIHKEAGGIGHSFAYGFFVVDEFGRHIYASSSPKEFERIKNKFKKNKE